MRCWNWYDNRWPCSSVDRALLSYKVASSSSRVANFPSCRRVLVARLWFVLETSFAFSSLRCGMRLLAGRKLIKGFQIAGQFYPPALKQSCRIEPAGSPSCESACGVLWLTDLSESRLADSPDSFASFALRLLFQMERLAGWLLINRSDLAVLDALCFGFFLLCVKWVGD